MIAPIHSLARALQGEIADIRAKELDRHLPLLFLQKFVQADGERIDFFARGAAGYPDANGSFAIRALAQQRSR